MKRVGAALLLLLFVGGGLGVPDLDGLIYHRLGHAQGPRGPHVEPLGQTCHPDWCLTGVAAVRDPAQSPVSGPRIVAIAAETAVPDVFRGSPVTTFLWSSPLPRSPPSTL